MNAYAYPIIAIGFGLIALGLVAIAPWLKRKGQQLADDVERVKTEKGRAV